MERFRSVQAIAGDANHDMGSNPTPLLEETPAAPQRVTAEVEPSPSSDFRIAV